MKKNSKSFKYQELIKFVINKNRLKYLKKIRVYQLVKKTK